MDWQRIHFKYKKYKKQKEQKGDCSSPADLARKLGVSRARVAQVMQVLRLDPEVLKAIVTLGDPLPTPLLTERRLRPLVPPEEQRRRVEAILAVLRGARKLPV